MTSFPDCRWKRGACSLFAFGADSSSHPWPCRDIVHVCLTVSSWLLRNAGQLSMHGKSKSVVCVWVWFHCDSLVNHSLTLDSAVEAETRLRPSLCQFRNVHPSQVILRPRAVAEEWVPDMCFQHHLKCYEFAPQDLKKPFNLFQVLLIGSSQTWRGPFFMLCKNCFPTHQTSSALLIIGRMLSSVRYRWTLPIFRRQVWMYILPVIRSLL